ncbi:ThuA domain-containing protein [Paenibacillus sacheonensis]|uniref:Trehalose utilization protein ThuA n=1 Tax=Paenibacillus sacheonensis TaxID=742054 RepID=A0A7X4YTZ1_9BACL|nr:ThuA domain-containing protein [Paenibacillus sacheonensis]MBM7568815.1 trehalose utilization protein [Paenibacillus sacheonensis]NBC72521.1 trehalose utilization protein ThuA [Paenibacillus sacheonensis]
MTQQAINVTIWNEYRHEKLNPKVGEIYPQGMHAAIAEGLNVQGKVRFATLDEPEHGLTEEVLNDTDVLIWWGHLAHHEVSDEIVERVQQRVLHGMGLIVLHSGHFSKIFKKLMGTGCDLKWREADEKERIWIVNPAHPIAAGLGEYFELPKEEMYGEHFDIPQPDELVMVSWFEGGEVFRSGCCFTRGSGKVFYFRPGHETYPTYRDANVRKVIDNAVKWAAPVGREYPKYGHAQPLEEIKAK